MTAETSDRRDRGRWREMIIDGMIQWREKRENAIFRTVTEYKSAGFVEKHEFLPRVAKIR